jgi:hypothetical protein
MRTLQERYKNIGILKFCFHIKYTVITLQEPYKSLTRTLQEPYKDFKTTLQELDKNIGMPKLGLYIEYTVRNIQ